MAAVSAYEAHTINVKDKVENAMTVNTLAVDGDTMFPEEFLKVHRSIALSTSAEAAMKDPAVAVKGDLIGVNYKVYAEWKAGDGKTAHWYDGTNWIAYPGYYEWLGYCLWVGTVETGQQQPPDVGIDTIATLIGGPTKPPVDPVTLKVNAQETGFSATLDISNLSDTLIIAIDAPVFEDFYNQTTDLLATGGTKQNGMDHPTWTVPKEDPTGVTNPLYLRLASTWAST